MATSTDKVAGTAIACLATRFAPLMNPAFVPSNFAGRLMIAQYLPVYFQLAGMSS